VFGRTLGLSQDAAENSVVNITNLFKTYPPIKRSGLPEDIAKAALWLASDESSFITGHALVVDGRITIGQSWSEYVDLLKGIRSAVTKDS
jgi:NAD(P)-dependent dehydrogenase (short-subunit alcohol dehydrogenase family)